MRTNLPVTNVEYPIDDQTLIVSKTDTKGKLVYFNDQFVAASGFTDAELAGQPHNIIRHPDMPPGAFENLWTTLKAGKPWAGAVKNRRKNGDFYWCWQAPRRSGRMAKLPAICRSAPSYPPTSAGKPSRCIRCCAANNPTITGSMPASSAAARCSIMSPYLPAH